MDPARVGPIHCGQEGQQQDGHPHPPVQPPAGFHSHPTAAAASAMASYGTGRSSTNMPNGATPSASESVSGIVPARGDSTGFGIVSPASAEVPLMPQRRRRNRQTKACLQCRQRKIKCDLNKPCGSCVKSDFAANCIYSREPRVRTWLPGTVPSSPSYAAGTVPPLEPPQHSERFVASHHDAKNDVQHHYEPAGGARRHRSPAAGAAASFPTPPTQSHSSPTASVNNSTISASGWPDRASRLESMIEQLQQQLAQQSHSRDSQPSPLDQTVDGPGCGDSGGHVSHSAPGLMSKTRYYGQSHWMNGLTYFPLITGVVARLKKENDPAYVPFMLKCKSLAKSIKTARVGDAASFDIGKLMPSRDTALRLVDAYLRTFETVYRILHVPTFWREFRQYWENPAAASQVFIIQMQLCMAIGTCFDEDISDGRPLATQWIYEAQLWLTPPEKSRMTLSALQIMCLLHLGRETCGIGGDLTWISSGSLMRCAMYMGLHHDPDHFGKMPTMRAELRRRLWATILEMALQSSLDSGGPPLISPSDYDTKQPGNFDDDQLREDDQSIAVPRPQTCFTQTSVQLTLLRSFPTRLSVAQYVNGFHASVSYEQTSRLNAQLQQVSASLQHSYDPAGVLPRRMTLFQLRLAEHMVHRFFLALNQPCLSQSRTNADYWFARKACVESSKKLCEGFLKTTPAPCAPSLRDPADDFVHLSTTGAGAFRSVPVQCMVIIGVELIWQALDDRSIRQSTQSMASARFGAATSTAIGVLARSELLEMLEACVSYQERRVSCGETNVKGCIFSRSLLAQVQALFAGASDQEVERAVFDSMRVNVERCWNLLAEKSGPQFSLAAGNWTEVGEVIADGKDSGEVQGFGGGWDWDDDQGFDLDLDLDHLHSFDTDPMLG